MDTARLFACACMCLSIFVGCVCGRTSLGKAPPATSDSATPEPEEVDPGPAPIPDIFPREQACLTLGPDPSRPARLVDIIMVVDNGGNMGDELVAIQNNINAHFADRLRASGVNYQVILLSAYGKTGDKAICIPAPLGGMPCDPIPSRPQNGAHFFHYSVKVDATNALSQLLSTYALPDVNSYAPTGWKTWLREGSLKAFIAISTGNPSMVAAEFEAALLAKAPAGTFGDATHPNHIFHSIVGVAANVPPAEPWQSTDPIVSGVCSGAGAAGVQFQHLSTGTGGLRFPVCELSNYGAAFEAIAEDIRTATSVQCDFTPPAPADGQRYVRMYVEYAPTGNPVEQFLPAADLSACTATGFLQDTATNTVSLCPQACAKLRADATARIEVLYACTSSAGL